MRNAFHSEQDRQEKLLEIGNYLRQLREEQSISLEEVAAKTKIQARLLRAIEQGELNQLPEPVYIQGFIKRFANALGLDGAEVANYFPTGSVLRPIKPSWQSLPAAQLRPIHLYVLYIGLIIGAVHGLSYWMERPAAPTLNSRSQEQLVPPVGPGPANGNSSNSQRPAAPIADPRSLAAAQDNRANQPNKPVRVSVSLRSQSWIRVVADGRMEFEGVLPEGSQRSWMADNRLTLRAGNAGGVMVTFNGNQTQQLGDPGAVEEVTFEAGTQAASLPNSLAGLVPSGLSVGSGAILSTP